MRKFSLLLLSTIMSVCLISSCSDDDDNKVNNSIVGTWAFSHVNTYIVTNNIPQFSHIRVDEYITKDVKETDGGSIYTFTADNKFTHLDENAETPQTWNGTYTFSNGKLTLDYKNGDGTNDKKVIYETSLPNGLLCLTNTEVDYKILLIKMELNELIAIGIDDADFRVEKADYQSVFARK